MFVRQVKRKCSVRGCKCTDSFAISRTREVGNTVIICKSCLGKALGAIDEIDPKTKSNIPKAEHTKAPALFFNAKALGIAAEPEIDDASDELLNQEQQENGNEPEQDSEQDSDNPPAADGDDEPEQDEPDTDTDEDGTSEADGEAEVFKCPICGKEFGSEKGLNAHLRYCQAKADTE